MNRSTSRLWGVAAAAAALAIGIMAAAPVPEPTLSNTERVQGALESLALTEQGDLVIRLRDDRRSYYVNRYAQTELDLEALTAGVPEGASITLTTIDRFWSPLDPLSSLRPVAAIEADGRVYFDRVER